MADLIFAAQFVTAQVGKTGLTVTVDVDRYTISDGSRTVLVTGGAATEGRRGLYSYRLASANLALYQYIATFITTNTTVDQQEIPTLGLVVPDALVSAVTATVDYASVRAAIGMAAANLDIQLDALPTAAEAATATAAAILVTPANKLATSATGEAAANVTMQAGVLIPGPLALESTAQAILEDTGTTLPGLIAAANPAGSGAISFSVTVNDESSNPVDGVEVWISTDSAGASVVAGTLSTDALGLATFMLDAGTYYLWLQRSGYNFTNPVTIVVS